MSAATDAAAPYILVVDDDPKLARILGETLRVRMADARVETCTSGEEALAQIAAKDFDVLVTDLLMPQTDGFALLREARQIRPEILAIFITGADDRELSMRALRAGAYDFIPKPVQPDELAASVRRATDTRRLRREVGRQQEALRRHAEELEQLVDARTRQLRDADRVKDEFLATISHELRTPLTAILGWARLLCDPRVDEAMRTQGIQAIARNARSQARLIDDLLDVSRIITGKLRLDVRTASFEPLVRDAVGAVLPAAQGKDLMIEVDVDPGIGELPGDPQRLQQVLWNLLANAVKFTPPGGRIKVSARKVGGWVEARVSDTGCGIRPELLPFVFDRLRQGDHDTGSRRGLGLGLAIVRHLVELHGGTVDAASEGEGLGATFTVRLPGRPRESSTDDLRIRPPATSLTEGDASETTRCLEGRHVLVVEDEEDAREIVGVMLRRAGAHVAEAGSAAEALDALRHDHIDVVLCDIGLPDEDGHALMRHVRQLPAAEGGDVPAIAFTAYARPEDRDRALEAGFQLHLAKPGPADLPEVVARVVAENPPATHARP